MTTLNDESVLIHFQLFLDDTINLLQARFKKNEFSITEVDGNKFEKVVFETIEIILKNSNKAYSQWVPQFIGGKKFPDIILKVSETYNLGIEVKTSKGDDWKTLGGSIMESTRVNDVNHISILFAKTNPFKVRHKPFELSVSDVAVTHSPRYLIDLDVDPEQTIFKKIKTDYKKIWQSEKPFENFRQYFKNKAKKEGTGLWWIEDELSKNINDLPKVQIQFFTKLPKERRNYLISKSMILFPNIFASITEYDEISIWLLNMGILNKSLRDTYSAGSNVVLFGFTIPSKFSRLNDHLPQIQEIFKKIKNDESLCEEFRTDDPKIAYDRWVGLIKGKSAQEHAPFLNILFSRYPFI